MIHNNMDTESTWAKVSKRRTMDPLRLWFITTWTMNLHKLRFLRLWFITIWTLNLHELRFLRFLEFICDIQSSTFFPIYDSWNNNPRILVVLTFPKCGLPFLCFKHYRRYLEFCSDFPFINTNQNCRNLN